MALIQQPVNSAGTGSDGNSQPSHANLLQASQNDPTSFCSPSLGINFSSVNHVTRHTHALSAKFSHTVPWIIDSGATDHIASSLDCFRNYFKIKPISITLPNGALVSAHYAGTVQFSPEFVIYNVLYVPDFHFNLVSISKLISTLHYTLIFSDDFCKIQEVSSLKMIGLAKLKEGLYHLVVSKERQLPLPNTSLVNTSTSTPITTSNLWHFRLGHLSGNRLNILHQHFSFIPKHVDDACDVCHLAKQRRLSYSPSMSRASKIFELIHMDIWGPFSKTSVHGHKYFLTILDDYSRYTWVVLLKSKAEVKLNVENFIIMIENQFETKVKCIRSDNGPEFFLRDFFFFKRNFTSNKLRSNSPTKWKN